jgi:hypothetical protein
MLSENHNLNLKLCTKQYNKIDILHPIVVPQLSGSRQHNYPTKTRELGCANEQSTYSLMSMKKMNNIELLMIVKLKEHSIIIKMTSYSSFSVSILQNNCIKFIYLYSGALYNKQKFKKPLCSTFSF